MPNNFEYPNSNIFENCGTSECSILNAFEKCDTMNRIFECLNSNENQSYSNRSFDQNYASTVRKSICYYCQLTQTFPVHAHRQITNKYK